MLSQIVDCYLRINDLILGQLRSLMNEREVEQGLYPLQYSKFFSSVEGGLQRELNEFRLLGQEVQRTKIRISSVEEHFRKLDDCE
jgi:hypothetical protein